MQKKLIALAVAGLMSAPAFAQSNVTIYGVVDFGYKWTGDSAISGVDSRSAIDSGISAGNRLGFKGTEDLGNGLKASFVYETGIQGDTNGSSGLWGGAGSRQSYVALSGNFGTVALGRQYTPAHALLAGNIDPFGFGKGTVASLANVYISPARLDNLAAYVSPTFGGFSVVAAYTNSASGDESAENGYGVPGGSDARAWAIAPTYKNGPIYVALNVHQIRGNATSLTTDTVNKTWDLGGTYDFGVVKLGAVYGVSDSEDIVKHKQWALTAAVPVGAAGKVQASFVRRKSEIDGGDDARVSQWGIGYEHALSKRTALYTAYADINNKGAAKNGSYASYIGDATRNNTPAAGGTAAATSGAYERGFTVGIRHSF
ncbi:outer membrane porin protein [Azoarcus olearius]|uniref:porin n=1 Tax=Azoarcus sp. (strain BH72) TaxID=418699 RepID=UPI000806390D|nr:porin [Azoarcus olearius]ANQ86449.1 outer membrane porin protein [Azoarcus olearius]